MQNTLIDAIIAVLDYFINAVFYNRRRRQILELETNSSPAKTDASNPALPETKPNQPTDRAYVLVLVVCVLVGAASLATVIVGNITPGWWLLLWGCICWLVPVFILLALVIWIQNLRRANGGFPRLRWLAPLSVACGILLALSSCWALGATDTWGFELNAADYNQVVSGIRDGSLPVGRNLDPASCSRTLPARYQHLSMDGTVCVKQSGDVLSVSFENESEFLSGDWYLYQSDDDPSETTKCNRVPQYAHWYKCFSS